MKRILLGLCVVTLTVSTACAGELKIDEREDVIIVEYSGSGAGKAISIDEAAEIAQEDAARAAARQLRAQEGGSSENATRPDSASRRAKRTAAKTVEGGEDGQ